MNKKRSFIVMYPISKRGEATFDRLFFDYSDYKISRLGLRKCLIINKRLSFYGTHKDFCGTDREFHGSEKWIPRDG